MARTVFLDGTVCRSEFGCDFCLHAGTQTFAFKILRCKFNNIIMFIYSGETTKIGGGSARVYPEPIKNQSMKDNRATGKRLDGDYGEYYIYCS